MTCLGTLPSPGNTGHRIETDFGRRVRWSTSICLCSHRASSPRWWLHLSSLSLNRCYDLIKSSLFSVSHGFVSRYGRIKALQRRCIFLLSSCCAALITPKFEQAAAAKSRHSPMAVNSSSKRFRSIIGDSASARRNFKPSLIGWLYQSM